MDRWLISELSFPYYPLGPYYEKIAVSETDDPTGPWYLYAFEYEYFCDYPKIGVWHDGYYLTTNNNYWEEDQWHFHAVGISVLERDSMLVGAPNARMIFFDLYPNTEPWSMLPADVDGNPPPDNEPAYLAHYKDGYPDRIGIYTIHTDWSNPENSVLELSQTLLPEPFSGDLPNGIPQPENAPYLASLSNRLLYRLQYRNFEDYQTMVTNHTVNTGNGVAGIRWYEFRNLGFGWQIHQQGTYSPDITCRWMGSIAMDGYGNIALGYSVSGYDTYPSIRFTGRYKGDPPGVMTIEEKTIINGSGVQLSPYHRWGDYSSMSVDPVNQSTFWYTQEYYEVSGEKTWQTRIAAFNFFDAVTLEVVAGNDSLCRGDSTRLFAFPGGGDSSYSFNWTSSPPGFNSAEQNPWVSPDINTRYHCLINDGVNTATDSVEITVIEPPIVYAGPDTSIMEGQIYFTQDAMAEYFSALKWSTSGDGWFDDSTYLYVSYSPGMNDISSGMANLSLTAFPLFYCDTVTDTMMLTITSVTDISTLMPETSFISLSPNPTDGVSDIRYLIHDTKNVSIELYNVHGKKIRSLLNKKLPNGEYDLRLDTFKLLPGIYFVRFRAGEVIKTAKVIVVK